MINTAYIHENDFLVECMQEYNENAEDIQHIMGKLSVDLSRQKDMKALGIYMEDADDYFTESVGSAISALGDKILNLLEKLKTMIKDFSDRLMGRKKIETEVNSKIDKLRKENPKLADKLEIKLSESDFKIDNVKDLNEYYKNVDELIERLKKDDVDPKTIQGKFEKVKEKLEKNSNAIKSATAIIGAAISVGTLAFKLKDAKKTCSDVAAQERHTAAQANLNLSNQKEMVKFLRDKKANGDTTATTKLKLFAEMVNHKNLVTGRNLNGLEKLGMKILQAAGDLVENAASRADSANSKNERFTKNLGKLTKKEMQKLQTRQDEKNQADRRGAATHIYGDQNANHRQFAQH